MDPKDLHEQNIKFQKNVIYRDVEGVASIYIETLIEDILPFQYNKVSEAINLAIEKLAKNDDAELNDRIKKLDRETQAQINAIYSIPSRLTNIDHDSIKQALIDYLVEKYDFYVNKDQEIRHVIKLSSFKEQEDVIKDFIVRQIDEKKQELRIIIANEYDEQNHLVGYNENTASTKQIQAWLNRIITCERAIGAKIK